MGKTERPPNTDLTVMQTDPDEDDPGPCHEHDYRTSTEPAALDLSLNENKELRGEISKLRKQIEDLTVSSKFCLERFSASDEKYDSLPGATSDKEILKQFGIVGLLKPSMAIMVD
ncbi:hypothetical protein CRENBAI_018876 [Crenichthys baileyi]|uniref:Uncharacterized protein n=1 Tax=Crenichthys baileyi TaxID=28760 RepID=A0AAV9R7G9_9TELE